MAAHAPALRRYTLASHIDNDGVLPPDPAESAREAGLRYVSDERPGIRRRRAGKGFRYVRPDGTTVKDEPTLRRIKALVIPPAWTDVWIAADPRGHIQATGRAVKGCKQYRYHPRWRAVRDELRGVQGLPCCSVNSIPLATCGTASPGTTEVVR